MLRIYKKYVDVYLNKHPDGMVETTGCFVIEDENNTQEEFTLWEGRAKIWLSLISENPVDVRWRITYFTKKLQLWSIIEDKFVSVQPHDILYKKIWYRPASISMEQLMKLPAEKVAAYLRQEGLSVGV